MASDPDDPEVIYMSLSGTRVQSIQRLQIGLSGLAAMGLLVGLATVIMDRARQTEAAAVPEAVSSTAAEKAPSANDALADAGVAPDVAAPANAGSGGAGGTANRHTPNK
ncbi:MAG: hypothetical protein ACXWIO_07185 [Croceibacterium sp.]